MMPFPNAPADLLIKVQPKYPMSVRVAAIIWLFLGITFLALTACLLALITVHFGFRHWGIGEVSICCGAIFFNAVIYSSIGLLRGKLHESRQKGWTSIGLAFVGVAAMAILRSLYESSFDGSPTKNERLRLLICSGLPVLLLVIAGILAIRGDADYRKWREMR